ncbi:high affinity immunoglobulin epsilon receptor subunit alpha [Ctenodactylus gundi]
MAAATEGCALLCIALLLFSPDGMLTATYKSRISLSPPWNRILEGDNVTLTCHGDNSSKDSPTKWIHNGTVMSEVKTSSLDILNASFKDSGKYQCQRQNLYRSALVYLDVCRDWLILQASAPVVMEDESISLRCHGWRNWTVYKVIYYKDDEAFKFCYDNDVSTPFINAIVTNSGAYYCTGKFDYGCFLGQQKETYSSEPLTIAVMKVIPQRVRNTVRT